MEEVLMSIFLTIDHSLILKQILTRVLLLLAVLFIDSSLITFL